MLEHINGLPMSKGIVSHDLCRLETKCSSPRDQERMRPFHASPQMDESPPVDFAFMPQHTLEASMPPEIMRIPLLPHNSSPSRSAEVAEEVIEPVVRPQISTVSADSTHIESPSSMVEVVDNHAVDLDPYDLTRKVAASASRTAEVPVNEGTEPSSLRDLWNGLLDRVSGSRKLAKAS